MPHNVGYCCINNTLRTQGVFTGRTMRKSTFHSEGIHSTLRLAIKNAEDLTTILRWNATYGITLFRMGSGLIPWLSCSDMNLVTVQNSPELKKLKHILAEAGKLACETGQRITAHPDHFVKLASLNEEVVNNSIDELNMQAYIFDLMDLPRTRESAINIHVGMNYSPEVTERFITNMFKTNHGVINRLVVENDDKANAYSVKQLLEISKHGVPITFDYFHHTFHPDGLTSEEAANIAAKTWKHHKPLFHYSESKNLNENLSGNARAHADYVFNKIDDYGLDIDIDLEAKAKEQALFKYRQILETV